MKSAAPVISNESIMAPPPETDPVIVAIRRYETVEAQFSAKPALCDEETYLAAWREIEKFEGEATTRDGALEALRYAVNLAHKRIPDTASGYWMMQVALKWFERETRDLVAETERTAGETQARA